MKTTLRNSVIHTLAPFAQWWHREKPRIRVIAFHDIPPHLESRFKTKLCWLRENSHVVSLGSLFQRSGLDEQRLNVAITFDDGYKDSANFAAPVLRDFGLPATFFVPSGAVDSTGESAEHFVKYGLRRRGSFEFMNREDIQCLARDPLFEIGGHTTSHTDLGQPSPQINLKKEISEDKSRLEAWSGKPLRWFAFPFGQFKNVSRQATEAIREAGYLASFTIVPSFWTGSQNSYLVGRDSLSVASSDALWESWLRGGYDTLSRLKGRSGLRALGRQG